MRSHSARNFPMETCLPLATFIGGQQSLRTATAWSGTTRAWMRPRIPRSISAMWQIRQRIILQPHGGQWVFALEWPGERPARTAMLVGRCIAFGQGAIFSQWHYEVTSYRGNRQGELFPSRWKACTPTPPGLPACPRPGAIVEGKFRQPARRSLTLRCNIFTSTISSIHLPRGSMATRTAWMISCSGAGAVSASTTRRRSPRSCAWQASRRGSSSAIMAGNSTRSGNTSWCTNPTPMHGAKSG